MVQGTNSVGRKVLVGFEGLGKGFEAAFSAIVEWRLAGKPGIALRRI